MLSAADHSAVAASYARREGEKKAGDDTSPLQQFTTKATMSIRISKIAPLRLHPYCGLAAEPGMARTQTLSERQFTIKPGILPNINSLAGRFAPYCGFITPFGKGRDRIAFSAPSGEKGK